jgi:hypothetical protein
MSNATAVGLLRLALPEQAIVLVTVVPLITETVLSLELAT